MFIGYNICAIGTFVRRTAAVQTLMKAVYSDQEPMFDQPSIFLAGPTPRTVEVISWRISALQIVQQIGFPGTILIPERHDWVSSFDYVDQVEWEFGCLEAATIIVFWIPRDPVTLPGFTTNVEFGRYVGSGRCVYGRPNLAPKNRYLDWLYYKLTGEAPCSTLVATVHVAVMRALAAHDANHGNSL